nr:M56 family metallopeptidase [uncultured Eisenbergiella sp.]
MYELFRILPQIINMTLAASCAGCVVLLLRAVLRKVPSGYFYALWIIVFLRFLCPFTLESAVSLIPVRQDAVTYKSIVAAGINAYTGVSGALPADSVIRTIPAAAGQMGMDYGNLLVGGFTAVWLTGMLVFLAVALRSWLRLKKQVAEAVLLFSEGKEQARVYESPQIASPFLLGFVRPAVYLPAGMKEKEKQHVLAHEYRHIRRRDYLLKPVCFLAVMLHWFNPLAWLFFRYMTEDMERSCDDSVLRNMTAQERGGYAQTLLRLGLRNNGFGYMLPAAFGESNTKKRITHILNFRKPSGWLCAAALLLVAAAGVMLLTSPAAGKGGAQEEESTQEESTVTAGPLEGEALAAGLSDNRNPYIGDHIRDAVLFGMLPVPEVLEYRKMELQTTQEPYELIMVYRLRENAEMPGKEWSFSNAALLFASIENAGKISYAVEKGAEEYRITYDRGEAEAVFGPLYAYSADTEKMAELQGLLSAYLENGMTISLGEERIYDLDSEGNRTLRETAAAAETSEEPETGQTENTPVRMELDKDVYALKEPVLTMTITNLSDYNLTFGDPYDLMKEENGEYRLVPMKENTGWHDILHVLRPGEETKQEMDISQVYGELEPGNYCINKSAAVEKENGEEDSVILRSIPFVLY